MELALLIYAIGILNSFGGLFGWLAVVTAFILPIYLALEAMFMADNPPTDEEAKEIKKRVTKNAKIGIGCFVLLCSLNILLPDEETSYTMLAAYGVQEVVTNEKVQNVASDSVALIEQEIGEYLEKETKGE